MHGVLYSPITILYYNLVDSVLIVSPKENDPTICQLYIDPLLFFFLRIDAQTSEKRSQQAV